MGFISTIVLGALGVFIAAIYFSNVILPIIYGFPKAVYHALRSEMKWIAAARYLAVSLFWIVVFSTASYIFILYFGKYEKYVSDSAFVTGSLLATLFCFWRSALSVETRSEMKQDFLQYNQKFILKDKMGDAAEMQAASEAYRNIIFIFTGFFAIVTVGSHLNNIIVYFISMVFVYGFLLSSLIELFIKGFALILSAFIVFRKSYLLLSGNNEEANRLHGLSGFVVTAFIFITILATIYASYFVLSIISPEKWNIFNIFVR